MPIDNSTRFPKPLAADLRELSEGMAIVIDGDTAPKAIASGKYLFIKNHSTLATGGYHATAAIASGADITSSNVTPDPDGIANALNEQIVPFAVLTGTTNNDATEKGVNYPTGYTQNNTVLVGVQVQISNGRWDFTGSQMQVFLQSNVISIAVTNTAYQNRPFKILIAKYE